MNRSPRRRSFRRPSPLQRGVRLRVPEETDEFVPLPQRARAAFGAYLCMRTDDDADNRSHRYCGLGFVAHLIG